MNYIPIDVDSKKYSFFIIYEVSFILLPGFLFLVTGVFLLLLLLHAERCYA